MTCKNIVRVCAENSIVIVISSSRKLCNSKCHRSLTFENK